MSIRIPTIAQIREYKCGCSYDHDTGEKHFCDNTKHEQKECGCCVLGGYQLFCSRHAFLALLILFFIAVFAAGFAGWAVLADIF